MSQPLQRLNGSIPQKLTLQNYPLRLSLWTRLSSLAIATACFTSLGITTQVSATPSDPELQVGVVQRFGTKPNDELTLQATSGDRLTLAFETGGQRQSLSTSKVKVDVVMQPLPEPQVSERVVLSTHRSFESAEDSAEKWRAQGIEVEVAQPERWQVWAKRDVYSSPLLRRLLLQSLQDQGNITAYIDSQVLAEVPKASFVVDGYRYTRDQVQISSGSSLVQVTQGSKQ
ncbi:MAG TPA: hypothetical protein V6C63_05405, partial [Allocoleopsis sp.]